MTTIANASNSSSLLKTIFGTEEPAHVARQRCKLLSEIKIDPSWGGDDNMPVVVSYKDGAGVSADFSTAQAEAAETGEVKFALPGRTLYGVKYIAGELIARTRNNRLAYAAAVEHNIKRAVWAFNQTLSYMVWGSGGVVTTVPTGATLTGATLTFTGGQEDLFRVGGSYQFASDDGTGTSPAGLRATTALTVSSISGTTVTFSANLNTVTNIAVGDSIFLKGSYGVSPLGVKSWVPITAPSAGATFLGVDRAALHTEKLCGVRYAPTTGGMKIDTIRDGLALAQSKGVRPTRLYCNPLDQADIVGEIQGAFEWAPLGGADPKLGHTGIRFEGPSGQIMIVSEEFVPKGYAWGLDPSDLSLCVTDSEVPKLLNEDGIKQMLRAATADAYEVRLGMYGPGIKHMNPGNSLVLTF